MGVKSSNLGSSRCLNASCRLGQVLE